MKTLITTLLLICCWPIVAAQDFRSEKLSTQSQLPVANVHRIMQDSQGFMWYATEGGGLCRDDGYHITTFRSDRNNPNLLATNDITTICEAADGNIWFGTTGGGYILDKKTYQISPIKETKGQGVSNIFCTSAGEMLVAVVGNIYHYSAQYKLLRNYPAAAGRTDAWTTSMAEDRDHNVYINVVNDDIYRLDNQSQKLVSLHWPYNTSANYIAADSIRGGLWVGTWGLGVVRYKRDFSRIFETMGEDGADSFQSQILNLVVDQHRNLLWVTTMEDLYAYRIDGESLVEIDISAILPQGKKIIDCAILDRHDNLWVPGYSPHTFILRSTDGAISRNAVEAMSTKTGYRVMVDRIWHSHGPYYWIWQGRTSLSLYNTASDQLVFSNEQASPQPFTCNKCIEPTADRKALWTARGADILRVRHDSMTVRWESYAHASATVRAICDNGQQLWVGTTDGIEVFDQKSRQSTNIVNNSQKVHKIRISTDGIVFFVSDGNGFACVGQDGKVVQLVDDNFTSLDITPDGTVWAATSGGSVYYCKLPKKTGSTSSLKAILSHEASNTNGDAIKDIISDARGHIWLLSDQYLREFYPPTGASRVIRNTDSEVDMDYFHTLQHDGGPILLGGIGAFCTIAPSLRLETADTHIVPLVTAYYTDGTEHLDACQHIKVPKGTRETILCISTFDNINSAKVQMAYRLSSNDEWTELEVGQNRIYLPSLQPGSYTLEIKATDEYGRWSESVECAEIVQMDNWWRMPWVRWTIIAIAFLLIIYSVIHFRQKLTKISRILIPKRFHNIFATREELEKLRIEKEVKLQENAKFIEKAKNTVLQNLDNTEFGVEQLSAELGLSRQHLHRRLQALTELAPVEFIRNIRLEQAAQLLVTTTMSINEVSDRTGFGTARYFTQCFKQKYGQTPKAFRQNPPEKSV